MSRRDEQGFALLVRLTDMTMENYDDAEFIKLLKGVVNNCPELLPEPTLNNRVNRHTLSLMGKSKPPGMLASELPFSYVDPPLQASIGRYTGKLVCALYYRHKGRIATSRHMLVTDFGQFSNRQFMKRAQAFLWFGGLEIGRRGNVKFGNQFKYRYEEGEGPDFFGMIAEFGTGLVVSSMLVEESLGQVFEADRTERGTKTPPWRRTGELYLPTDQLTASA